MTAAKVACPGSELMWEPHIQEGCGNNLVESCVSAEDLLNPLKGSSWS